jgi:hypothetical protein
MSFRIAQLQELRTAPAAHEGHQLAEGPIGLAGSAQDGQRVSDGSRWPLGIESGWRPSVLFFGADPLEGEGLHDGWDDGWCDIGACFAARSRRAYVAVGMRRVAGRSRGWSGGSETRGGPSRSRRFLLSYCGAGTVSPCWSIPSPRCPFPGETAQLLSPTTKQFA